METTLADAPIGTSLVINAIADPELAERLNHMGLYDGARLTRLNEAVSIGPVKVQASKGVAVLSGWLASHVVIHLDHNGQRLPLLECKPGQAGHVEGIVGRSLVENSLKELGIAEKDLIVYLRALPPMNYKLSVDGKSGIQINEGLASHILGRTPTDLIQFCSVGVGEDFVVLSILPGEDAERTLAALGIRSGSFLVLHSVAVSHNLPLSEDHHVACLTKDGLRLYLCRNLALEIKVSY